MSPVKLSSNLSTKYFPGTEEREEEFLAMVKMMNCDHFIGNISSCDRINLDPFTGYLFH